RVRRLRAEGAIKGVPSECGSRCPDPKHASPSAGCDRSPTIVRRCLRVVKMLRKPAKPVVSELSRDCKLSVTNRKHWGKEGCSSPSRLFSSSIQPMQQTDSFWRRNAPASRFTRQCASLNPTDTMKSGWEKRFLQTYKPEENSLNC